MRAHHSTPAPRRTHQPLKPLSKEERRRLLNEAAERNDTETITAILMAGGIG